MKNNRAFRNYTIITLALAIFACCTPVIYSTLIELTKELETDFEPALQATCIMLGLLSGILALAMVRALGDHETDDKTEEKKTTRYVIRHKPLNTIATYYNDKREWTTKITDAKHYHAAYQAHDVVGDDALQTWAKDITDITVQPIHITK